MRGSRSVVTGLAVVVALTAAAVPAWAHTQLKSRYPGSGSRVSASVSRVSATFTQQVRSGSITVRSSSGRAVGSGGRSDADVTKVVARVSNLRSGRYRASWRVRAIDGHIQSGSWSFRVR